jgi:hypothetical protein
MRENWKIKEEVGLIATTNTNFPGPPNKCFVGVGGVSMIRKIQ